MMICCLHVVLGAAAGVVAVCMHACMHVQPAGSGLAAWLPSCMPFAAAFAEGAGP